MTMRTKATVSWLGTDGNRRFGVVVGTAFFGAFYRIAVPCGLVYSIHASRVTEEMVTEVLQVLAVRAPIDEGGPDED